MRQFSNIKLPKVPRNNFNLSHERRFTADMFYLYPVLVEDCIPGDIWNISNEIVIRMNPMVTPIMHEINVFVHYFFVPYRLLWKDFEDFITGGKEGKFVGTLPVLKSQIPVTEDSIQAVGRVQGSPAIFSLNASLFQNGGIMDYLGYNPVGTVNDYGKRPLSFPALAYNFIWQEYYRDQNVVESIEEMLDNDGFKSLTKLKGHFRQKRNNAQDKGLEKRSWEKDYFTSMLPWQQRGTSPGISISGVTNAVFRTDIPVEFWNNGNFIGGAYAGPLVGTVVGNTIGSSSPGGIINTVPGADLRIRKTPPIGGNGLDDNVVDFSKAIVDTDVSDLRLSFQIQKFLERNARTGVRYTEFLRAHFPAFPRDDRLNRPEYIGGSRTPVIVSEVLQTSQSNSGAPQGNMAGHGLSADRTRIAKYRVQEFGLIMGIMSIMPRTMYQQGVDRVWLKESKYDFYFPEFANLSEQAVYTEELFNHIPLPVDRVMGYQGRYDEYRYKRNSVHGLFRDEFDMWHMGRKFSSAPTLNEDLITPNTAESNALKRVLAVPSQPMFLVAFGNKNSAIRPLPYIAEPGLVDHG